MGPITMSAKEAQRPGLVRAARDGKVTNREGAAALGLSVRQFRRLRRRFEQGGTRALLHRGRGRPSWRRIPESLRSRVARLMQGRYAGFNDCHLAEVLQEREHIAISRATLQRLRAELGLEPKRRRRAPRHRRRREREARRGALVLVDASEHPWCEDRCGPFALLGALDDATGEILGLLPRPHEDLHGYATLLQRLIEQHGLPATLYGDRTNIFVRNDRHWSLEEQLAGERDPTQGGRMLRELGIGYIPARSPQAKGRIERFWGTLQNRLVSVLRLKGAASMRQTLRCLPEFIASYNQRFARPPQDPHPAWRTAPRDFHTRLACHYTRVVARDNTVALPGRWIQIPRGPSSRSYGGCRVQITERLDGRLLVHYHDQLIAEEPAPPGEFTLVSRHGQCHRPPIARPTRTPKPYKPPTPSPHHPWKRRCLPLTLAERARREDIPMEQ